MGYDDERIGGSQEWLLDGVRAKLDGGRGQSLLMGLKEVAVSSGSACTSASLEEPSYVSRALGVDEDMAHTSIRFGIDRRAIELTVREMSPLYEMMKEGSDINGHNTDWLIH
uniref:Cysteine desulfurase n=1 Tax=Populus trichocarpa TaxID=3694 RepID=A0A2K1Z9H6_POPTR